MADLVLLCRHVNREDEHALAAGQAAADGVAGALPVAEPTELVAVAAVLAGTLANAGVRVAAVRHAPSPVARLHATWLASRLRWPGEDEHFSMEEELDLSPSHFNSWSSTREIDRLVKALTEVLPGEPAASYDRDRAVLVVGHMPQLAQNMLRIWTFLFTPATVAVVVGLLALAYAALEPGPLAGALAAAALVDSALFAAKHGPVLGSQD